MGAQTEFLHAYFLPADRESLRETVERAFGIRLTYGDSSYYSDLYLYWPSLRKGWVGRFRKPENPPFVSVKITPNGEEQDPKPFNAAYSLDHWDFEFQVDGSRDIEVRQFLTQIGAEIIE